MKYKIYKLTYKDIPVYVGKTTQTLKRRKVGNYKGTVVEHIDKSELFIELLEETNDISRENYWIEKLRETNNILNKKCGDGLDKKLKNSISCRKYYNENKENSLLYREENKDRINKYAKEYSQKNKELKREYDKARYKKKKLTNI